MVAVLQGFHKHISISTFPHPVYCCFLVTILNYNKQNYKEGNPLKLRN